MYILVASAEAQTIKFNAGTAFRLQSAPLAYKMNNGVVMHFLLYGEGSSYHVISNYSGNLQYVQKYATSLNSGSALSTGSDLACGVYTFVLNEKDAHNVQLNIQSIPQTIQPETTVRLPTDYSATSLSFDLT